MSLADEAFALAARLGPVFSAQGRHGGTESKPPTEPTADDYAAFDRLMAITAENTARSEPRWRAQREASARGGE